MQAFRCKCSNRFDPNGNTSRAMENGISDGSNMMDNITSEQLVTMLWRQAGSPKADTTVLNSYADGAKVSGYAKQAVAWAIQQGILSGKGRNMLDPTGLATRAETAAMFKRYFG